MAAPEQNRKVYKLFEKNLIKSHLRTRLSLRYGIHPKNFKDDQPDDGEIDGKI